jgi:hypothetical protein
VSRQVMSGRTHGNEDCPCCGSWKASLWCREAREDCMLAHLQEVILPLLAGPAATGGQGPHHVGQLLRPEGGQPEGAAAGGGWLSASTVCTATAACTHVSISHAESTAAAACTQTTHITAACTQLYYAHTLSRQTTCCKQTAKAHTSVPHLWSVPTNSSTSSASLGLMPRRARPHMVLLIS